MTEREDNTHSGARVVAMPAAQSSELAQSIASRSRDLPSLERFYTDQARLYRVFYTELLRQGFDEDDAIRLTESEFCD